MLVSMMYRNRLFFYFIKEMTTKRRNITFEGVHTNIRKLSHRVHGWCIIQERLFYLAGYTILKCDRINNMGHTFVFVIEPSLVILGAIKYCIQLKYETTLSLLAITPLPRLC